MILLYVATVNEFYHWIRDGRRSEMSDLVALAFFFFVIFFFTRDLMTSLMGAFSIYLWIGVAELKDYPVINKILIISLVTYNVIFIAGLISTVVGDSFILDTTFAFSFWLILILGFALFGRKYIVVWRFLSPEYLTLLLYVLAWLAVGFINQYTPIKFTQFIDYENFTWTDFFMNIYFILIVVNWGIYFISGPILDKMLGMKRVDDENLLELVEGVKKDIGVKGKVKVSFGKYPILNAMAYGSIFDKRIGIISETIDQIPEDELKGIVAHELAHTKGKHTLILTFITSGDLVFRMLLGLPATYYDYTFGEPRIPMLAFIFLNIGVYIILFIFVRILEGKADLKSKEAGYTIELAKALYNLESFYATGREIGLNTMLLCDEKITKDNQIIDYIDTAKYIHNYMIKPSRGSLLGNLINSHPPTYHRIGALLADESKENQLKPTKEALLPFICMKKSKQKKYAKKFEKARIAFSTIANEKFKDFFGIKDIKSYVESLGRREIYKFDIGRNFIFKNKITDEIILGKLEDVQFLDNVCNIDQFVVLNLKNNEKQLLEASLYNRTKIDLNKTYFFDKDTPLLLSEIEISDNKTDGNYIFVNKENENIIKSIKKTKLPNSAGILEEFKDKDVFFKMKGDLKILRCNNVVPAENFDDYELELMQTNGAETRNNIKIKVGELIIRPKAIYISIRRSSSFRKTEVEMIKWLLDNQLRAFIYLKKPVNNIEIGYVKEVNVDLEKIKTESDLDENNEDDFIVINNIFGKEKRIPYKTLEFISFEYKTAMIQKKSETSVTSKLGYKIAKKFKPQKVLYLQ